MQYQKYKYLLFCLPLCCVTLVADESILSKNQSDIFKYQDEQNSQNSQKLRKDWINEIVYKYSQNYTDDGDTSKSYISINQPIFKSGGIYSAIKYANSLEKYNTLDISLQRKAMIQDALTLLFQIHRATYSIEKEKLTLKNAQIDVQRKKEQVLNGFLDTSYLDNAILDANQSKNSLAELKYNKEELINSFDNLSSKEYTKFELPKFKLIEQNTFLEKNLEISKSNFNSDTLDNLHTAVISNYLPTLNLTYDYTKYHDVEDKTSSHQAGDSIENYGFNITVPLNINALNDIQSNKIEYLKSKTALENVKLEQKNLFKTTLSKIKMLDEKISIAKEDYELYNSLLKIIYEEKEAEIKTQSDVETLENSQKVKLLESKILYLDKQIELLELYSKVEG